MAKRLSGRQVLNLIFDDDSNPEDSESSDEENQSSGSECQVESDGSDQQEESEEGDDVDMVFFSPQMWDHIVECTNNEGQRVKQELWTLTNSLRWTPTSTGRVQSKRRVNGRTMERRWSTGFSFNHEL